MIDKSPERFEKRHDYLICVDSDGCAVDTMEIKHSRCFGPRMIAEWGLEQWRDPLLKRWKEINL
ncbi:MAG: HAD family hydrolase, partial [Ruminococcus sp.]|nr:HAD family hydrolase [Ruminococcus sp.]